MFSFKQFPFLLLASLFLILSTNCGIKTDKELMKELEAIRSNCDLGDKTKHGWKIEGCKNNEVEKTKKSIKEKGVANSLPTLVVAFSDNENEMAIIATYFFNWSIGHNFDFQKISKNPELIETKVAKELIQGFKKRKEEKYTMYAVRTLANVAMIKNLQKEYWELVDSYPKDDFRTGSFYSAAVQYGRLQVLDRIKTRAKEGKSFDQLQMISATGIIQNLTDDEKATLCPWWGEYLGAENRSTAKSAARNIVFKCSGDIVDSALTEVEKRIKELPYKDSKDFRFSVNLSRCDSPRLTEEQCKKADELKAKLEKKR